MAAGGTVWFVNFADQRIWKLDEGAEPVPVTPEGSPEGGGWRFADLILDARRGRLIAVGELHGQPARAEPLNVLVSVETSPGGPHAPVVIATGADFYGDAPPCRRREPAGLDRVEPPQHAVGRNEADGGRRSGFRQSWRA